MKWRMQFVRIGCQSKVLISACCRNKKRIFMKELKGRFKYLIVVLIFIILMITYYTVFGERGILQLRKLERNTEKIKASTEKIKQENENLKNEIELLQGDDQYIERIAREDLGLVREDEIIYKKEN
ncbi:MAG: septum formation initiator family protein [Deltaproteobacteria bacterium]|nr:septum formation initiator family protein [Deltaproteobacteria bacterium]